MTEIHQKGSIPVEIVDGFRLPKYGFPPKNFLDIQNLEPKPNDILISTFPKSGTHWYKYVVWEILNEGKPPPLGGDLNIPFVDIFGVDAFEKLDSPRVLVTHIPLSRLPNRDFAKYIYTTRNPFDCCVSYFHFLLNRLGKDTFTFDQFFEDFLHGLNSFGDFFDHMHDWYVRRNDPNVLMVSYEEMTYERRSCVLKIARFLGEEYFSRLESSEDMLENILKYTTFDYMKSNLELNVTSIKNKEKSSFLRKGVVGTWKEMMSSDQKERLMKKMMDRMEDKELLAYWKRIIESPA